MLLEAELSELQRQMAQVDLLTEPRPHARPYFIEFLVLKLRNLKIKMYQETGHQTPHVHAITAESIMSPATRSARRDGSPAP